MRFLQFKIKNFKGIEDLEFNMGEEKRIYTMVGLNESGKTSILEAINVFANDIPDTDRHKYIPKNKKYNFNDEISVAALVELNDDDVKVIKDFMTNQSSKKYDEIDICRILKIERRYSFQNSKPTKFLSQWDDLPKVKRETDNEFLELYDVNKILWNKLVEFIEQNLLPQIVYYPNFLFDFPEKIYLEKQPEESPEYNKYRDVIQDILFAVGEDLTIKKDILPKLKNPNNQDEEVLDLQLDRMSQYVSKIVFSAWEKLFNRGNKEIIIKHGKEPKNVNQTVYYFQFKLKEGLDQFFISERSLGFKWFFSFLLFTGIRQYRISNKSEVLFLLDEPASNLHPTAQKNLLKTFEDILGKSSIIYTTHSHYLINPEWIHGMYIVRNKAVNYQNEMNFDPNTTNVEVTPYKKFVSQYPNQREYFQAVLDTLDYQPGLIEKVPFIIIVEGKSDFFAFNYINKIILANKYKLHFYPGGGANADEQVIRLYIAWDKPFIILRDSDDAGKKSIEKYKKIFSSYLREKAFNFQDISEELDNKSLEDLFTEEEKLSIARELDSSIEKYEKTKFSLSIQLLLAEKRKIEVSQETIDRFDLLFNFLSSKIAASQGHIETVP